MDNIFVNTTYDKIQHLVKQFSVEFLLQPSADSNSVSVGVLN